MSTYSAILIGRDEKGGLPSTKKKAVVDVDQFIYWSASTSLPLSTGQRRPAVVDVDLPFLTCLFLVVDVDLPFSTCLFLLVDVDLPFSNRSTCLFSNWSTVNIRRRPSTSILQPFSSRPLGNIFCSHLKRHTW